MELADHQPLHLAAADAVAVERGIGGYGGGVAGSADAGAGAEGAFRVNTSERCCCCCRHCHCHHHVAVVVGALGAVVVDIAACSFPPLKQMQRLEPLHH